MTMAETAGGSAEGPTNERGPQSSEASRGIARAVLQRRVEAARKHPDWNSAMRMAAGLASKEARTLEVEVSALNLLENGILSVSDLFLATGRQGL